MIIIKRSVCYDDIKPFIRYVQRLTITEEMPFLNMTAYDNRLFYAVEGQGVIQVCGTAYSMKPGCLMIWRAGLPYELRSAVGCTFQMLGCNFDFTQNQRQQSAPVPPGKTDNFREEDILDDYQIEDMEQLNNVVYLENMQSVEEQLRQSLDEYLQQRLMASARLSGWLILILTEVVQTMMLLNNGIKRPYSRAGEILKYIRMHYGEELSNNILGERFNYHPNYINQMVAAHTGMSLHQYLLNYRIQQAVHYLQNTDYSAQKIAELTGFRDYNYFLKYFKKKTGYTTRRFRP